MNIDGLSVPAVMPPHNDFAQALENQNIFGKIFSYKSAQSTATPSHRVSHDGKTVYLYAPDKARGISQNDYLEAKPSSATSKTLIKDSQGNFTFNSHEGEVFATRVDPNDILYRSSNGQLIQRQNVEPLDKAQDVLLQATDAPHIFRLYSPEKGGGLATEMYAYPKRLFFREAEANAWALTDGAVFKNALNFLPYKDSKGRQQMGASYLDLPADTVENLKLPRPSIAPPEVESSSPKDRLAKANATFDAAYGSNPNTGESSAAGAARKKVFFPDTDYMTDAQLKTFLASQNPSPSPMGLNYEEAYDGKGKDKAK